MVIAISDEKLLACPFRLGEICFINLLRVFFLVMLLPHAHQAKISSGPNETINHSEKS
jgi:hypothetical protein